jgi:cell division protein FtsQ
MVKRILTIVLWVFSAVSMVALFAFARQEYLAMPVKSVQLTIDTPAGGGFLEYKHTYSMLMKLTDSIPGKAVRRLQTYSLKKQLVNNPYISKADVFSTMDGVLKVSLTERDALVRVFDSSGQSAYIDSKGILFPLHPSFTARVLVANGEFAYTPMIPGVHPNVTTKKYSASKLNDIYQITKQINADDFLKAFIAQIYVDSLGEYELTPRISSTNIVLGPATDIAKKLKNLKIFYINKAMKQDLYDYKTVSFKFKDQIVCTKREVI